MITYWFPTGIYHSSYAQHQQLKGSIIDSVFKHVSFNELTQSWIGNPPNSCKKWNPLTLDTDDIKQFKLWVEDQVTLFAQNYGSTTTYSIKQCWANVYREGNFQETHYHPGWDFSAVYFLSAPEGSGNLIFESPLLPDMRPIKTENTFDLNNQAAIYKPIEGQLVIFRSNLRHGAYPHNNTDPRITLAFNLSEK